MTSHSEQNATCDELTRMRQISRNPTHMITTEPGVRVLVWMVIPQRGSRVGLGDIADVRRVGLGDEDTG